MAAIVPDRQLRLAYRRDARDGVRTNASPAAAHRAHEVQLRVAEPLPLESIEAGEYLDRENVGLRVPRADRGLETDPGSCGPPMK